MPFSDIEFVPPTAVTVPPVHVPPTFGVAATCSPEGNVSTNDTVCAGLFVAGLVIVLHHAKCVGLHVERRNLCYVTEAKHVIIHEQRGAAKVA